MDIKKQIQSLLVIIIIVLIPFISIGQQNKIDDYKYSISAGMQYGIFNKKWWYPENHFVSPASQSWDHLADSIKYTIQTSWHIKANYNILSNKFFTTSIGVGISSSIYNKKYFYSDSLIASNSYFSKAKDIQLLQLNIPITFCIKHKRINLSTGFSYIPIWYEFTDNYVQNGQYFSKITFKHYILNLYPFISTSYLLIDKRIQILPVMGIYYTNRNYSHGPFELFFSIQFRFK